MLNISSLMNTELIKAIQVVLVFIFAIVIVETAVCTLMALQFRVEELSGFRSRFLYHYDVSARRDGIVWAESKNSWFLWLSVLLGNVKINYAQLYSPRSRESSDLYIEVLRDNIRILISNIIPAFLNIGRYFILVLSVPFYLFFTAVSYFERLCRAILKPLVFFWFWVLAKLKIIITYYFKGTLIIVDSINVDTVCPADIIYRKPVIRVLLHKPEDCPDPLQKDNLNHFTVTLKGLLPPRQYVKFKTEIVYPAGVDGKSVLPMTTKYLGANYANLFYKKSKEDSV